ncbi:MAG: cytochrome P450 [Acidimicrobiales bacterium]
MTDYPNFELGTVTKTCGCDIYSSDNVVLRCDRHVRAALVRTGDLSSRAFTDLYGPVIGRRSLVGLDGDDHQRLRSALTPLFDAEAMSSLWRPAIEERVRRAVADLTAGGRRKANLVDCIAQRVPAETLAVALGLGPDAGQVLARLARSVIRFYEAPKAGLTAAYELRRLVTDLVASRRSDPARHSGGLVDILLAAEVDGVPFSDREAVDALRLMVPAGIETTAAGMANVLYAFLKDGATLGESLPDTRPLRRIAEEGLRWAPPTAWVVRRARHDLTLDDLAISEGTTVLASLHDANHDHHRYPAPQDVVCNRGAGSGLAFGFGRHTCLGVTLALEEITCVLGALQNQLPWMRLDRGAGVGGPNGPVISELPVLPVIW